MQSRKWGQMTDETNVIKYADIVALFRGARQAYEEVRQAYEEAEAEAEERVNWKIEGF